MMDKLAKRLGYENWVICRSHLSKGNLYTVVALNSLKEIAVAEHKQEMEEFVNSITNFENASETFFEDCKRFKARLCRKKEGVSD